jgi:hypothetical protein
VAKEAGNLRAPAEEIWTTMSPTLAERRDDEVLVPAEIGIATAGKEIMRGAALIGGVNLGLFSLWVFESHISFVL